MTSKVVSLRKQPAKPLTTTTKPQVTIVKKGGNGIVANYARLIDIGIDLDEGPNVSPPNEWGVIENVFDENNSQMLSTGLKSPEELVALINQKNEFFAVDFGIDFADGTPIPGFPGAVTAGNFAMYPYGTAGAAIHLPSTNGFTTTRPGNRLKSRSADHSSRTPCWRHSAAIRAS